MNVKIKITRIRIMTIRDLVFYNSNIQLENTLKLKKSKSRNEKNENPIKQGATII